jgi:hypothetical protein
MFATARMPFEEIWIEWSEDDYLEGALIRPADRCRHLNLHWEDDERDEDHRLILPHSRGHVDMVMSGRSSRLNALGPEDRFRPEADSRGR